VEDVLQQITRDQIKEARANELKTEILRSAALKTHFEEHPRDLEVLTSTTRAKRSKMSELKYVPDYLRPTAQDNALIKQAMNTASVVSAKRKKRNYSNTKKRKNDPLRSMKVKSKS
jgi:ATP-dependent RNA helicase DDX56/DBP9